MSTINKKPYIKNLLESLDDDALNSLSLLIDGGGNQEPIRRTMNLPNGNKTKITEADKGVHLCSLEINYSLFMGYLVYNDDYCCLIWFTDSSSQVIKCFNINLETNAIETVSEELSVLELRSELYDIRGGSGGGSEVVANPTLAGTESNLEGLEVDGEKYKIPEGTEVIANPTLAGTESPLTGLQVGDTKYAVGGSGGSHCYKLIIANVYKTLYFTDDGNITDKTTLLADFTAKGYIGFANAYLCCDMNNSSETAITVLRAIYRSTATSTNISYAYHYFTIADGLVTATKKDDAYTPSVTVTKLY